MTFYSAATLYLLAASLCTYGLFWHDKRAARRQGWRVQERILLLAALLGGSLGAKAAQRHLRHKTRKQPCRSWLNLIFTLQLAALTTALLI
jgi:uncharacterized membrane protein YsdA (DUF1294 family)